MPGDIGLVASAIETFAKFFLSEDGYGEFTLRRAVEAQRREVVRALQDGDWVAVRIGLDALKRLSDQP